VRWASATPWSKRAAISSDPTSWAPEPQPIATTEEFFAHLIRPTTRYRPDIQALRAASTRIVVARGTTSKGQLANRTAVALAGQLATTVIDFPGDHGGFVAFPQQCGHLLDQVLTETA